MVSVVSSWPMKGDGKGSRRLRVSVTLRMLLVEVMRAPAVFLPGDSAKLSRQTPKGLVSAGTEGGQSSERHSITSSVVRWRGTS